MALSAETVMRRIGNTREALTAHQGAVRTHTERLEKSKTKAGEVINDLRWLMSHPVAMAAVEAGELPTLEEMLEEAAKEPEPATPEPIDDGEGEPDETATPELAFSDN